MAMMLGFLTEVIMGKPALKRCKQPSINPSNHVMIEVGLAKQQGTLVRPATLIAGNNQKKRWNVGDLNGDKVNDYFVVETTKGGKGAIYVENGITSKISSFFILNGIRNVKVRKNIDGSFAIFGTIKQIKLSFVNKSPTYTTVWRNHIFMLGIRRLLGKKYAAAFKDSNGKFYGSTFRPAGSKYCDTYERTKITAKSRRPYEPIVKYPCRMDGFGFSRRFMLNYLNRPPAINP